MTSYIPVPGTWSFEDDWWRANSPLERFLATHGLENIADNRAFWSTRVEGANVFKWVIWGKQKLLSWHTGGRALADFLSLLPLTERNVIAHSHGGQVVFYAAREGVQIRRLITVGTPVRKDLEELRHSVFERGLISSWLHLTSGRDYMAALGGVFDRHLGIHHTFPEAQNVVLKGIGHSKILRDPKKFALWESEGWIDFLCH